MSLVIPFSGVIFPTLKCWLITLKTRADCMYLLVITTYLIHAVGQFCITSKQKYKLPMRALCVWVTEGTVFPTSRPLSYLFLK